ncbi:MAG: MIP/aquaporin family protein [Vicinamibacterales bacterium]
MAHPADSSKRLAAEGLGTALLLAAIVGSGIMADRLAGGQPAVTLLANSLATGATLAVLILVFGPVSGAHLNPAVTVADAWQGGMSWRLVPGYLGAQFAGAIAGVILAHLMFGEPALQIGQQARSGAPLVLAEFVATFGLLAVIWGCVRQRAEAVPFAVGLYIVGAFWFTSSTSFANPAVTVARALTDTFTGLRPADVPAFVLAQFAGAVAATAVFRWLIPGLPASAADVVVPHASEGP